MKKMRPAEAGGILAVVSRQRVYFAPRRADARNRTRGMMVISNPIGAVLCPPNRRNRLDQMLSKSVPSADMDLSPLAPPSFTSR